MSLQANTPSRLIILSAPSGAGKTTLSKMLIENFPEIKLSISATTRPRRPNEIEGVHYFFMDRAQFMKKVCEKEFVEWAEVHDHWYGTLKKTVDSALKEKGYLLFDIDVKGARKLKELYPDQTLLIFIHPPSMETLKNRLLQRKGDSPQSIERRLQNAYNEIEWSKVFDYQIINDTLEKAYLCLKEIVQKHCL